VSVGCSYARDQFFAGSGFAGDEHRSIGRRHSRNHETNGQDSGTDAEDFTGTFQPINGQFQQAVFAQQLGVLAGAASGGAHYIRLKRLGHEIERALPHALHGQFDGSEGGEKDDGKRRVGFADARQHIQPLTVGHFLIGDNGVVAVGRQKRCGFGETCRFGNDMPILRQIRGENFSHITFIVDD
jgi:hypothetical protein